MKDVVFDLARKIDTSIALLHYQTQLYATEAQSILRIADERLERLSTPILTVTTRPPYGRPPNVTERLLRSAYQIINMDMNRMVIEDLEVAEIKAVERLAESGYHNILPP